MKFPPTPWAISSHDYAVRDADGDVVLAAQALAGTRPIEERVTVVRRITAAVNACQNLGTIELESITRKEEQVTLALLWSHYRREGTAGLVVGAN